MVFVFIVLIIFVPITFYGFDFIITKYEQAEITTINKHLRTIRRLKKEKVELRKKNIKMEEKLEIVRQEYMYHILERLDKL